MTKQITTTQHNQVVRSGKQKLSIALSLIGSAIGGTSLIIFGYSHLALISLIGGFTWAVATFIYHHITSGAYLPEQREKKLRQKLMSLKFKLEGDDFQVIINKSLEYEKKIEDKKVLLESVLARFFTPSEMTFRRYHSSGMNALGAIESNLYLIVEKLETIQHFEDESNKKVLVEKINNSINEISNLFKAYEELIMSFEACEIQQDRDEIFMQLEELAKRTEKYSKT